jgi:hypothetical protein
VLDAIRPHPHRGDVIAAGAVVLTVAVLLTTLRMDRAWGAGAHLALTGLACALVLAMALLAPLEGETPRPYHSVLLIAGLALLAVALLRLAGALGADDSPGSGALTWTALVLAGTAAWIARTRNSAICTLIAAAAAGGAALAFVDWAFDPRGSRAFRWVLLVLMGVYVFASLQEREGRRRHAVQLINAAGLAALAIGATYAFFGLLGAASAGAGWELVLFAAGCGLAAYAGVDREPGPGYLGFLVLLSFVLISAPDLTDPSLLGWPLVLLALGGALLVIGLRPRRELPPEPGPDEPPPVTTLTPE